MEPCVMESCLTTSDGYLVLLCECLLTDFTSHELMGFHGISNLLILQTVQFQSWCHFALVLECQLVRFLVVSLPGQRVSLMDIIRLLLLLERRCQLDHSPGSPVASSSSSFLLSLPLVLQGHSLQILPTSPLAVEILFSICQQDHWCEAQKLNGRSKGGRRGF